MKDNRTELQKEFEEQTPTIKGVNNIEYLRTFVAWLHFKIEQPIKSKSITYEAIKKYGSFRKYAISIGKNETTFKRTLESNLQKLNDWVEPLGLEIQIVFQNKSGRAKILKRTKCTTLH